MKREVYLEGCRNDSIGWRDSFVIDSWLTNAIAIFTLSWNSLHSKALPPPHRPLLCVEDNQINRGARAVGAT